MMNTLVLIRISYTLPAKVGERVESAAPRRAALAAVANPILFVQKFDDWHLASMPSVF